MTHRTTKAFWVLYDGLPANVRRVADANFQLLKANPRHPSLRFKKAGRFWSARVGIAYRAIAVEVDEDLVWVWICSHADYDKMISGQA